VIGELEIEFAAFKDHQTGIWYVGGKQKDIGAQGKSLGQALTRFLSTIACEFIVANELGERDLSAVPATPDHIWQDYLARENRVGTE
jgi:hypothetical protein